MELNRHRLTAVTPPPHPPPPHPHPPPVLLTRFHDNDMPLLLSLVLLLLSLPLLPLLSAALLVAVRAKCFMTTPRREMRLRAQ